MSGSLELLGMLNPGMAGFAAAPAFDMGSAMGAMNPGLTGLGGGALSGGGFDAASPLTDNSSWWDRNMPSKDQVTQALGSLGAANKAAQGNKAATAPAMPGNLAAAATQKGGGVNLGDLVAMLAKRREALLASATGGVGAGRPQGLLGV